MIGITGATGEVGHKVWQLLLAKNIDSYALVRDPTKLIEFTNKHEYIRKFNFESFCLKTFQGINVLFYVLPNNHDTMTYNEADLLTAAKQSEIKHIVKLSVMHVNTNWYPYHKKSECLIKNSGIDYTFLRPNTYMQNFNNYELSNIKNKKMLAYPAGNGKTSFIDTRDIADAVVNILLTPQKHGNRAYTLTGSQAYDYHEITKLFAQTFGFSIQYVDTIQFPEYELEKNKRNIVLQNFFHSVRQGLFAEITDDFLKITGKTPRTITQYLNDYRDVFT